MQHHVDRVDSHTSLRDCQVVLAKLEAEDHLCRSSTSRRSNSRQSGRRLCLDLLRACTGLLQQIMQVGHSKSGPHFPGSQDAPSFGVC